MTDAPNHYELVAELRVLRERGLLHLRRLSLPGLTAAARLHDPDAPESPAAIEALLRAAITSLDPGQLADAASYTLGLAPGTRDWPAQDRRRRSAEIYGVTPEHFRKGREQDVLEQIAESIMGFCEGAVRVPPPLAPRTSIPFPDPSLHPLTFHVGPVELLTEADVLVSSENIYLEVSKTFGTSVSAAIRRAGAIREPSGEIVDDVIQRELSAWVQRNARPGLAVPVGTIAETSPGKLAANGVRAVYHAAVASSGASASAYTVTPDAIRLAVHNIFRLAAARRSAYTPPLSSLCFPLFGAGRSRLSAKTSASALWRAFIAELSVDPTWALHLVTNDPDHATEVLATLS
ncbi:hypothetical protein ABGB12_34330 [Actinocorallia sp. B10E7]|uniref:hypothetical protein n=1 Tax=Actinocorallia sp. B10E7 TaxID=3153558 RepID=UPI00325CC71D